MPKIKGKVVASTRKKPVKAGSTPRPHGGFPTGKVAKIVASLKKKHG